MIASAANFQQAAASSQPVSITEAAQADHPAQHSDTASELPEASDGSNGFAVVFAAALQQFASPQYVAAANVDAESGPVPECIADAQTAQEWDAQPRIEIDSFSAAHNASLLSLYWSLDA